MNFQKEPLELKWMGQIIYFFEKLWLSRLVR